MYDRTGTRNIFIAYVINMFKKEEQEMKDVLDRDWGARRKDKEKGNEH